MGMTVAGAKKNIVVPALRRHPKSAPLRHRDTDNLESLGFEEHELPQLAVNIGHLLREQGWGIDAKVFQTLRPSTRIADLTRDIAKHACLLGPKLCANGHSQTYPGQTVCDLDGLPFE
jgi:hypothetical protein